MSEERLNYIKEKVNMRNMANVMCGFNTDKTDNEILELIHEIEKLKQENKQLKEQLDYLRSNEYLNQVKFERDFNEGLVNDLKDTLQDREEYIYTLEEAQQRIDKAIEYIKNNILISFDKNGLNGDIVAGIVVNKLLEILGGNNNVDE